MFLNVQSGQCSSANKLHATDRGEPVSVCKMDCRWRVLVQRSHHYLRKYPQLAAGVEVGASALKYQYIHSC